MNEEEALALTGVADRCCWRQIKPGLGGSGAVYRRSRQLYMAGYSALMRETTHPLLRALLAEFNRYEFSRAMRQKDCQDAARVYSHIEPYMGGPDKIMNTNGAGDGAYPHYCMLRVC